MDAEDAEDAALDRGDQILLLQADAIIDGVVRVKAIMPGRTWPAPSAVVGSGLLAAALQPTAAAAASGGVLTIALAAALWVVSRNGNRHIARMKEIQRANGKQMLHSLKSWLDRSQFDPAMRTELEARVSRLENTIFGRV